MRLVSKGLYLIMLIFFLVIITPNNVVLSVEEEEGIFGDEINIDSLEPSGEEITARGNALVIYKGYHLEAETIYYNSLTGGIRMNGGISVKNEGYHLTANKLTGNLYEESFTVIGDVELTGTDVFLTGEELSYDNKTEEVIVKGRPYLEYHDLEYQDVKVRADHISYNITKKIAYLTGNVSGEQLGNSFSGKEMKANLETKKMTLIGKAHLIYENKGE